MQHLPSWPVAIVGIATFLFGGSGRAEPTKPAAVVPGVSRLTGTTPADAARRGQLLLGELGCIRCHKPAPDHEALFTRRTPPVLDHVGSRVRHGYLRRFLTDPQAVKPGTPMPNVLIGLDERTKQEAIEALTHLLASTGSVPSERPAHSLIVQGREVYHRVGCVACHGSRDANGNAATVLPSSVPLGDLKAKYTIATLRAFLENPHAARPSGRMPALLNTEEARQVANYLLQGSVYDAPPPNMTYAYYEGSWDHLPDFARLRPIASGKTSDFDLSVAHRINDMALRFEGWLRIDRAGRYGFHLTSDDGSKLWIDGRLIIDNDGVHSPSERSGRVRLSRGMHRLVVAIFNAGGGVELNLEMQGPGLVRQAASPLVFLTASGPAKKEAGAAPDSDHFAVRPELVEKGRRLFAELGCANCHDLTAGGPHIEARTTAPTLDKLHAEGGCLAARPATNAPRFALSAAQRADLAAALRVPMQTAPWAPRETIVRTLAAFNCYACHVRDKIGGVAEPLNAFFRTVQPEMGDEGRLPPPLDGVGAKLQATYLRHIFNDGPKDRAYMFARMPRFGESNLVGLVAALEAVDPAPAAPKVAFHVSLPHLKATARHMVSGASMGCVKCHTFAGHQAEGIQAMDMLKMPQRLRHGWFYRYLLNPQAYRPGTRMPGAWPEGESPFPNLLDGSAAEQIEAIWQYLSDGGRAQIPPGMNKQSIPLVPIHEAIVYRNFIEGAGPRGIGVGYPEKANLAFDANDLRLAIIWQGAFIDAARHWSDRGEGWEPPLGDNVLHLPRGVSFAFLKRDSNAWPTQSARELPGYHFRGYRLTRDQRPTFMYTVGPVHIDDFPHAIAATKTDAPSFRRVLTLMSKAADEGLWFRAAVGNKIEAVGKGWYRIDGEWKMRLEASDRAEVRRSAGKMELLVPVHFRAGQARIVQEFLW